MPLTLALDSWRKKYRVRSVEPARTSQEDYVSKQSKKDPIFASSSVKI